MAKGIEAGRAFMRLSIDNSAFRRGLQNASRRMQTFGRTIARVGAGFIGFGTALSTPLLASISAASDAQETFSKFEVVFADNAKSVREWSDELSAAVGRSETETAGFLAGFQDLLVPIGIDPDRAEESSKQLTQLAFDLASFNNKTDADAVRDLQAALTGSSEVMKKYGVIVNQTAVNQELLNQGIKPKDATETQKVFARLSIIMAGTTAAQGDAQRTADGYANSLKALRGSFSDLATAIGGPLLAPIASFFSTIRGTVGAVRDFAEANPEIVRTIALVSAAAVGGGLALVALGAAFAATGIAISGAITVFGTISAVISTVLSPIGLAVAAFVGLGTAIVRYTGIGSVAIDFLGQQFNGLIGVVKDTVQGVISALSSGDLGAAGEIATSGLETAFLEATAVIQGAWFSVTNYLYAQWLNAINSIIGVASNLVGAWLEVSAAIRRAWATAQNFVTRSVLQLQKFVIETLTGGTFDIEIDLKSADDELQKKIDEINSARDAGIQGVASFQQQVDNLLDDQLTQRQQETNRELEQARIRAKEAKEELASLSFQAKEASNAQGNVTQELQNQLKNVGDFVKGLGSAQNSNPQGTFSSQAASLIIGRDNQTKILQALLEENKKIARAAQEATGFVFGAP